MRTRHLLAGIGGFLALGLMVYFCALPGDLPADEDRGGGLAGTYTVNGTDPLGVGYSGTVVIVEGDAPDRFDIEWIVTGGIHRGTGTLRGDRFEVEWRSIRSSGGTGAGTGTYERTDDGGLVGTRRVDGFDTPGTEEIFPDP